MPWNRGSEPLRIREVHYALESHVAQWTEDAFECRRPQLVTFRCAIVTGASFSALLERIFHPVTGITPARNAGWCILLILNSDAYAVFWRSRASVFGDCEVNRLLWLYLTNVTTAEGYVLLGKYTSSCGVCMHVNDLNMRLLFSLFQESMKNNEMGR